MDRGADIYRRYIGGEDDAMTELVEEFRDALILFINGYVKNLSAAEEICEDVFFRLAVKKPVYRPSASFRTWIFTVARNEALSRLRSDRGRRWESIEEAGEMTDDFSVLRELLKSEEKAHLHRAMTELKAEYASVLYLIYFEELSPSDAAAVMKMTKKQIGNLLYRAKAALRSRLEREGFVYEELQ